MKFKRSNERRHCKDDLAALYWHGTMSVHWPYIVYCTSVPATPVPAQIKQKTSGPIMLHISLLTASRPRWL